jgi:hypothetical protein
MCALQVLRDIVITVLLGEGDRSLALWFTPPQQQEHTHTNAPLTIKHLDKAKHKCTQQNTTKQVHVTHEPLRHSPHTALAQTDGRD